MRNIFKLLVAAFTILLMASCYGLDDECYYSTTNYQVIVSNGLPHYRNGRVDYYYFNYDYYYPYMINGRRGWRVSRGRPLPPPSRRRPPIRNFDKPIPNGNHHFGNMKRR